MPTPLFAARVTDKNMRGEDMLKASTTIYAEDLQTARKEAAAFFGVPADKVEVVQLEGSNPTDEEFVQEWQEILDYQERMGIHYDDGPETTGGGAYG